MIAKKIAAPKGSKNTIKKLVDYLADPGKQIIQVSNQEEEGGNVQGLVSYIGRDGASAKVRITNCLFDDDLAAAVKEMQAVQGKNTRSKAEKTYHLVISFQEGEQPTNDVLKAVEDKIVERIGYKDHQRISALHVNTNNWHLHVAINKVNPVNYNNVDTIKDILKMLEACRELEVEFGFQRDQNAGLNKKKRMNVAQDKEAHTGLKSLTTWIVENVKDKLDEVLNSGKPTWKEIHDTLNEYGLIVRKRGAGLVIQNNEDGICVKASSIGREYSKGKLEKILGEFEENSQTVTPDPKEKYKPEPIQKKSTGRDKLWEKYNKYKNINADKRKALYVKLKTDRSNFLLRRLRNIKDRKIEAKQSSILRYAEKREVEAALHIEKQEVLVDAKNIFFKKSNAIQEKYPSLTWPQFLQKEASNGNKVALNLLRYRKAKSKDNGNYFQGTDNGSPVNTRMSFDVDKRGRIKYQIDEGWIMDTGPRVFPGSEDKEVLKASLRVAMGRFGYRLKIKGDPAFVRKVKQAAIDSKISVTINGEKIFSTKEKGRGGER